jgi:PKD repeat protein
VRERGNRGQSLVEFALVVPVLLVILLVAIDFGRIFLGWIELNNAARIAANYAAAAQPPLTSAQQLQYRAIVAKETAGINCDLPNPIPDPAFPSGDAVGGQATVSLSCIFHPITPFMQNLLGGTGVNMGASANFPIRAGVLTNLGGGGGTSFVAPNQDFSISPPSGDAPVTANFTLLTQGGGTAQTWSWDFGDPSSGSLDTSSLENPPAHQYQNPGTYTVTLVETNPGGTSPTYTHSVTVTTPATAPVASFYGLVPAPCVDSGAPLAEACGGSTGATIYYRYNPNPSIAFFDTSQNASGATYAWDFGDPTSGSSNTSTVPTPSHTYTLPGAYTVTLTITTAGGTSTSARSNYINLGCIAPTMLNASSDSAVGIWTGANFQANKLKYWHTNGNYNGAAPNPAYVIGQQNPQATAFFTATQQGGTYACSTNGAVAPANVTPAP